MSKVPIADGICDRVQKVLCPRKSNLKPRLKQKEPPAWSTKTLDTMGSSILLFKTVLEVVDGANPCAIADTSRSYFSAVAFRCVCFFPVKKYLVTVVKMQLLQLGGKNGAKIVQAKNACVVLVKVSVTLQGLSLYHKRLCEHIASPALRAAPAVGLRSKL